MSVILLSFSVSHAWWSPTEGIRVTCRSYDGGDVPEININVKGYVVEIEKQGQVEVLQTRIYQTNDSKVWENPKISLVVALVQSSWGGSTHAGTLTYKAKTNPTDVVLYCMPEMQY